MDSIWAGIGSIGRGSKQPICESLATILGCHTVTERGILASRTQSSPHCPEPRLPCQPFLSIHKLKVESGGDDNFVLRSRCLTHDGSGWFISSLKMRFLGFERQHSNDQFRTTAHLYSSTADCSCKREAIAYFRNMYLTFQPVK